MMTGVALLELDFVPVSATGVSTAVGEGGTVAAELGAATVVDEALADDALAVAVALAAADDTVATPDDRGEPAGLVRGRDAGAALACTVRGAVDDEREDGFGFGFGLVTDAQMAA